MGLFNIMNLIFYRSGGVELIAQGTKFLVENTLESRLDLISRQVSPEDNYLAVLYNFKS